MDNPLKIRVLNPDKIVFEGEGEYVLAPGRFGNLGIFPGHTPMFAEIISGEIYIKGESEELLAVESGILKVQGDTVTILIGI
jgi:F-type H+-transporting ATPase subunit epsilon